MVWFAVMHVFAALLDWMGIGRISASEKDLEILLLRQQLMILERKVKGPLRVSRAEKMTLAVITKRLRDTIEGTLKELRGVMRIFQRDCTIFCVNGME